jgi:hypothetical protein
VVLTTREVVANSQNDWLVPVSHPEFPATCTVGETLVLGEYLAAGSEKSSLRLTVRTPTPPPDPYSSRRRRSLASCMEVRLDCVADLIRSEGPQCLAGMEEAGSFSPV